ncbi:MBL fold metallo-hydrolase [Streptomyces sp. R302]|uniref:MBL fold metallo-hydrolase n=1 Tax=unclassified Streptomyces TaxID=2593676 RepID=UPI00145EFFEB|nr:MULTISPECIES: MBL fold metallo-hydrolase [unclassified Streptomyces]NML51747.1 MBL fold metallo-hydrolase [Streptomyces sp. R301]NML81367.1 MBL fold metallo-hydrolase [Streptomyces sp. R302]
MPLSIQVGPYTVIALTDGAGPFFSPRAEAFPDATAEQWSAADRFDPGALDADGRWWLQFRAFAIRSERGVTLVDAGIGPADSPAASWAPVPGALPAELAAAGIEPDEVESVVITHLHTDHVGWAVVGGKEGETSRPFFPNAQYLLQQAELDALEQINPPLRSSVIDPLRAAGRLRLVDGETALRGGERLIATPGHTPGHQSVLVESGRELLAVTGDLLVHAIQLLHPELAYAHEMDPHRAQASRERVLRARATRTLHLATPHLTEPFVVAGP